ncbi:hypothetical protein LINPERPRIM_LOCUS29778 [Linum perenne]
MVMQSFAATIIFISFKEEKNARTRKKHTIKDLAIFHNQDKENWESKF